MLGAVMFGHQQFQPVIQAIIELAEAAAKEPWPLPPASPEAEAIEEQGARPGRRRSRRGLCRAAEAGAQRQARRRQGQARRRAFPDEPAKLQYAPKVFKEIEKEIVRGAILKGKPRIDGRDTKTVRPIVCEVGILPRAHGSALFTRGETQAIVRHHARHRPGRADHRRARRRVPLAFHAALQFPALLHRRSRAHGLARPARDRPRQARLARRPSAAAGEGSFPYTVRVVSEITEVERLVLDGDGVRRLAVADGCGRAAAAAGGRHRHGPDQGGPRFRRALRHPRRRGSSRRHGLQGGRHRRGRHRAADGHQDHLDHRGDHEDRAGPGARTGGCTSSARCRRRWMARARG